MGNTVSKVKNPKTYIDDFKYDRGYNGCITVEHRSHNPKRDFLFVNKYQCKHIPASPLQMEKMCKDLANKVNALLTKDDKVLIVGFAETATAIGYLVAKNVKQCEYAMCTTREDIAESIELITFEEEHSHATTQKLLIYNKNAISINEFNYILFVEDEISTGNTILNFIKAFSKKFNNKFRYGVASVCNWQSEENKKIFSDYNIDRFFLLSGSLKDKDSKMNIDSSIITEIPNISFESKHDASLMFSGGNYFKFLRLGMPSKYLKFNFNDILSICERYNSVRVIGSEECMIPAIILGIVLEKQGKNVICHSSTRSKIDVIHSNIDDETSGIKNGYCVKSAYDKNRKTYLYNTDKYTEITVIISDTPDARQFIEFVDSVSTIVNTDKVIGYKI